MRNKKQYKEFLTLNSRQVVYSFLDFITLFKVVSKLSSRDKQILINSDVVN